MVLMASLVACGGETRKGQTIITDLEDSESALVVLSTINETQSNKTSLVGDWQSLDGNLNWSFTSEHSVVADLGFGEQIYNYSYSGNSLSFSQNGLSMSEYHCVETEDSLILRQDYSYYNYPVEDNYELYYSVTTLNTPGVVGGGN